MTYIDRFLTQTKREPKSHRDVALITEKLANIRLWTEKSSSNLKEQSPSDKLNHVFMERFKSKEAVERFKSDSKHLSEKIMEVCGGKIVSLK